jgi:enoyl-CoA hydratase/carnithine racemase
VSLASKHLDASSLPATLRVETRGAVEVLFLSRPQKRNALDDGTVLGIERYFSNLGSEVRAVVVAADGDHFCAGLDLGEMTDRDTMAGIAHSQMWHRAFRAIEDGLVPVVAALQGAVVGGGLELAAACHIRVADETTFFALPEGQRGLFVGGGGSVRVPRLIGVSRMTDLMLTGRRYDATEGHLAGVTHYLTPKGEGLAKAISLAEAMASNAPQSNFAILQALPRIAQANPAEGYFMESLIAAVAQGTDDAKSRMRSFLDGRAAKVTER